MLLQWCLSLWFALLMGSFHSGVANMRQYGDSHHNAYPYKTIVVNQSGHGKFSTIQSAINSVPRNNNNWVFINIKAGVYREKVKIPYDKPYIILKGQGKRTTKIVWSDHDSTAQSPTFVSLADNTIAKSITFVNSFNFPNSSNPAVVPAVAAMIGGDKCSFYKCGFQGKQDTLWDDQGRHYFKRCTIQGSVDFIFGNGQSIYEDCAIQARGEGYITAQGRTNPSDSSGFVFKWCQVFGAGSAYLGRPWRGYARVIFYKSNLTGIIDPRGWNAWNSVGHEENITFQEFENYGPGADLSKRVKWINKLTIQSINELTSLSFINKENWLRKVPVTMK